MINTKKIIALILAGGTGNRFDPITPKQYYCVHDKMVIEYSLDAFKSNHSIDGILLVTSKDHIPFYSDLVSKYNLLGVVDGGSTRLESVRNAINYLSEYSPDYVLIHDACRPLISNNLIDRLLSNINEIYDVICPTIKITETIKDITSSVVYNIDRENKFLIQTPQVVKYSTYYDILKKESINLADFTDDSSVFESFDRKVKYIEGDSANIKMTLKDDLEFVNKMLKKTRYRTGMGFDAHKFGPNESTENFVMLGGVKIPHIKSIIAHSDGDVVIHALVDAMLGTIGAGDIGEHFPDSDPQWKGKDSADFLKYACSLLASKNADISNIDITIVCEAPKILSYKEVMKETLSGIIAIDTDQINIKATTTEKMGFTGRKEGIAVYAIVTISI